MPLSGMLAIFCLAIIGASLLGGILPLASRLSHTRLQVYLSLSAGAMLGAAFFHMMPEAVAIDSPDVLKWSAFGLLGLFFLERFFAFHHHEAPADPADPCPDHKHEHKHGGGHSAGLIDSDAPGGLRADTKGGSLHWGAAAFGLAVHSLAGGIALASAAAAASKTELGQGPTLGPAAWGVFLATFVHKPADALTIVSLMVRGGTSKPLAHLVNFGFALMIPLGVIVFFLGIDHLDSTTAETITACSLAFSAGTFLCIALSDLLPELQFHAHDRLKLSAALLCGVVLMWGASLWEGPSAHDHKEAPPEASSHP